MANSRRNYCQSETAAILWFTDGSDLFANRTGPPDPPPQQQQQQRQQQPRAFNGGAPEPNSRRCLHDGFIST